MAFRRLRAGIGLAIAIGVAGAFLAPRGGIAQDGYQAPPRVTAGDVAVEYLAGRFRMPVSCTRMDGSSIQLEESIVFRPAPESGRGDIKATFFGIGADDVTGCRNRSQARIPDRRGVLYLHFRSQRRLDIGLSEFRRRLSAGPLTYNVHRGHLQIREFGSEEAPRKITFGGGEHRIDVREVKRGSEAAKLLSAYDADEASLPRPRRRYSFHVVGPDEFDFVAHMIEDESRWR